MLFTNTIRYGTDEFAFTKKGLLYNSPLDCSSMSGITGFTLSGSQPSGTDRRVAFKVDGIYYKVSGGGAMTLVALPTQTITEDSVLAEGNTVDELSLATSIPGFAGKIVYPAIALMAPNDVAVMPTLNIGVNGVAMSAQTTRTEVSAPITLAATMAVDVIDLAATVTANGGANANVTVAIQQADGTWTDYMPLTTAKRKKAKGLQFKTDYSVATIGAGSAKVERISAIYRTNDAAVSGDVAEIISTTEDFGGVGMRFGRITVKHQVLKDAKIRAHMSMRTTPKTRERISVALGNGTRQTVILGIKDASGIAQPDTGINHNTIRVWHGSQEVFDFDFNTGVSQISTSAPDGVTVFASYSYGWEPESWVEMDRGSTQVYEDGCCSTEFTYVVPSNQAKGVAAVKINLEKPGGTVSDAPLGVANGKTQMIVLPHLAKATSVSVKASVGTASWNYDENSRILTVVALKDANMTVTYDWVAETPVCQGFVACWNE